MLLIKFFQFLFYIFRQFRFLYFPYSPFQAHQPVDAGGAVYALDLQQACLLPSRASCSSV